MHRIPSICTAVAACGLVVACGSPPTRKEAYREPAAERTYSQAERETSQLLSLGNTASVQMPADSYQRALLCRTAFAVVSQKMIELGRVSGAQQRAIDQAKNTFDKRLQEAGKTASKDASTMAEDTAQAERGVGNFAEQIRVADVCIRGST